MASKADYLKKYLSSEGGGETKKKRKNNAGAGKVGRIGLKVVDTAEDEWGRHGGGDGDEMDGPTVVDASELSSAGAAATKRGEWTAVEEVGSRRRRHDSESSDEGPPRRTRHDSESSDEGPPRRTRHDSDSDADPSLPAPRAAVAHDSDAEPPRKSRRHDSDDSSDGESAVPRKPQPAPAEAEAAAAAAQPARRVTAASGHLAGLQSGAAFREHEARLKQEREAAQGIMDEQLAGKGAETVYRDRKGRKLDMLNEFMRQQAMTEGTAVRIERAQVEWGKGVVQKQSAESSRQELQILAAEPFARAEDDPRMESLRRQEIRDGDPMAEYFASKQQSSSSSSSSSSSGRGSGRQRKPLYQGPAPPSNRFNILPGYRWDGVDRGNAWEAKILKGANKRKALKEDAAAWSMADM